MSYRNVPIDLTTAEALPQRLIDAGTRVAELFNLTVPYGVTLQFHFGPGADPVYVNGPFKFQPAGDADSNRGLYYTNDTPQPGVIVNVTVGFEDGA